MSSRMPPQAVAQFLGQAAVLRSVPPEVLAKLAPHVEQASVPAGRPLVPPGALVTTLGFLHTGRASMQIVDPMTGARSTLEEISPGDVFGEVGLMLGAVSPVVVIAEEDCEALIIQKAHFDKIAVVVPDAMQALAKRVAARFVKMAMLGSRRAQAAPERASALPSPAPAPGGAVPRGSVPFVEVSAYNPGPKVLELLPTRAILEHRALPLEIRGRTLVLGMVSPFSMQAKEELRRALHSLDPEVVAISADDFANTIVRLKVDVRDQRPAAAGGVSRALRPQYQAELKKEAEKQAQVMIGDEVVSLLDRILSEAVDRGVSDVHIEPEASGVRVRFRTQGMLVDRKEMVPSSYAQPLVARLKVLAEMDITERRLPQDGRIVAQFGQREMNFRISTIPAARGEKAVIRLLDPADVMRPLEHVFHDPRGLELVQRSISMHHGAIMVAGATGSGKSSTLYSILNARKLARPDHNIVTVEDPVEFLVQGFSQTPVNAKAGMEYPTALRALMRQDPDVIMVGELRDAATSQMLIEASLTGHLAISTLQGSNVVAVLQRLEHFGCDGVRLGQTMNVILVQKLARKLCPACAREEEVAPALVESLIARKLVVKGATPRLPRAAGCEACNMSGYRGRAPSQELLFFDDEVRLGFETGAPTHEILSKAEGRGMFLSFAHNARLLMAKRLLTPADALALTD